MRRGNWIQVAGLTAGAACLIAVAAVRAQEPKPAEAAPALIPADHFEATSWREISTAFATRPEAWADFTEKRYFPFKENPAVLRGEVRVSRARGLSLAYQAPDERIVIVDAAGLAIREKGRTTTPPADERSAAINRALMHVLRFDLDALATEFELSGKPAGATWLLTLVPRNEKVAQAFRRIVVEGEAGAVRRIELRRSQRQYIEITMSHERPAVSFTVEELARFFR